MKILVTGATGYVGGRLVPLLLARGHDVRTTTSNPGREQPWWGDRRDELGYDSDTRATAANKTHDGQKPPERNRA